VTDRKPSPLDEAFAETLRAIDRKNRHGKPDPLLRGISAAQAERAFQYVQSLANEPERLERVAFNAIVDAAVAKYWRDAFAKENRELRAELARIHAKAAEKGREGSSPNPLREAVIRRMADEIKSASPYCGHYLTDKERGRFTRALRREYPNAEWPSAATWTRWWRAAEGIADAERAAAEQKALDRLAPLMDQLCELEPPQPGERRVLNVPIVEALAAARQRQKPPHT
jgi:hypothetical protein